ncbi:hypothetical protein K1719_031850 [Acacia pycnantha]|nr:hypothetical protein K1719_031850 [Acacia pycnantha]
MLPPKRLNNPGYTVGLEPRVKEVVSLLNQSNDIVYMLGIHGTGGIGKTTLAKLILEEKIVTIGSVAEGISRIKHRLSNKKVFWVLDDVGEVEQLEQLAGGCDWFGYGSKVIITTRNKHMLIARNIEKTYEMMKLNEHHSLELFCWHAFHMKQPPENYQDMSSSAIRYAQGIPLALTVMGSNLANKNLGKWRSILEQYEKIQDGAIHEVLKISYDCLQDGVKRIFLDIACFVDEDMPESMEDIIEALDFGARFYLEVLVDKSLINFVHNDGFSMHDLIQQMGREIVRQEAPLNPKNCSKLWYYKDVLQVLHENLVRL